MQNVVCLALLVSSSHKVGMVCLVLVMYLFTLVMSKLAQTLSLFFFGVRTTLLLTPVSGLVSYIFDA